MDVTTSAGSTIGELAAGSFVLLTFLRHSGCTFCREALDDVAKVRPQVRDEGGEFLLVHFGEDRRFARLLRDTALEDVPRIHDPGRELYQVFGLSEARLEQWLTPKIMLRGVEALLAGNGIGLPNGAVFQMPGIFVLRETTVALAHYHQDVADRPDYLRLLRDGQRAHQRGAQRAGAEAVRNG